MTTASPTGYLVFDLESVPDLALHDPPPVAPGQERPFAPLYAQQVVVIGALWLDPGYRSQRLWIVEGDDERSLLWGLSDFIQHHRPVLVTFNGWGFDLPVVMLRALHHGLAMPWYFEEQRYRDRRGEEGHVDLCDALALHGRRGLGLNMAARLVGLPGKLSVDGSQVEPMYHAGELAAIQRYCLADVAQTALLLLRYRLLQGQLTPAEHHRAASDLCQALRRDGRLGELMQAMSAPDVMIVDDE